MAKGRRRSITTQVEPYKHPGSESLMRPDVGTQARFKKKKPAQTYRYDSSISPALDWDGQNPAREQGEALIARILEAASLEEAKEAASKLKAMSRPFLNWAGKAERLSFDVPTLPLFVHERLSTMAIIETLKAHRRDRQMELYSLFGDPQHSITDQVLRAYEHRDKWTNRMILGDSLVVMNSLLHYEGLGGQVQMIYMDPPYGVKFGSNFQPFVRKRDVKHNEDEDMTREPEMVQAYRDTWELGLHSYLTYLRDRLLLARELLTPSGSIFVQISDENLHHVREVMDEVFGTDRLVVTIPIKKKGSQKSSLLDPVNDYLLWYSRSPRSTGPVKYHALFLRREMDAETIAEFKMVEMPDGREFSVSSLPDPDGVERDYRLNLAQVFRDYPGARLFRSNPLTSGGERKNQSLPYEFRGKVYLPGKGNCWKTTVQTDDGSTPGMDRLARNGRLIPGDGQLRFKSYLDDFAYAPLSNWWDGLGGAADPMYVVQTNSEIVRRCILMTTDPGDLVLDPTCFRAGTRVKTEGGWKPIEAISRGERVWTHQGRLRTVIGAQARPHVGRMLGIKVNGGHETVWVTPEHYFLVAHPRHEPHPRSPSPRAERGLGGEAGSNAEGPPLTVHPTPLPPPHKWGGGQGEGTQDPRDQAPVLLVTATEISASATSRSRAAIHHKLGGKPSGVSYKLARELRRDSTTTEDILWQQLRGRRLAGKKFRRQHPVGPNYIADFYCAEAALAIELDGSIHDSRKARWADGIRHRQIQNAGIRVLRFSNDEVRYRLDEVLSVIREHLLSREDLTPALAGTPSPRAERGLGGEGVAGDGAGPIGPTPNPSPQAWRGVAWREARELSVGDVLVADGSGRLVEIESIVQMFTNETVYDLTVEDDHSFITEIGVAHNCGSGTTAYVAEQWGRRWITIDTSRVPLALARQRLLTATFPYYELNDESRGPGAGFVYKRKQNSKGEEVGGIVPHITLKSIANNEPPAEEILVDRPEVTTGITRVSGPFCFEATIPTPVDWEADGIEDSGAADTHGSFVDRMLEVLRKSPVLRLEGNRTVTFKNVRPPTKSLSLAAEALVEATAPGQSPTLADAFDEAAEKNASMLPLSQKPVAFVFGPENGAVSEKLVSEAAREAYMKGYSHLYVIGFAIQPNARDLIEHSAEVAGVPATYVQATPDLMMGDLLKNMRSSQIFSVCGLPEVRLHPVEGRDPKQYQVELLGLDVFDPMGMEVEHRSGIDVPAWFLDTDYNDLCFHVCQAFFPRTSAWDSLRKALRGQYEESVWDHLSGTTSAPFEAGGHKQIAVKVIDDRGNELMVVKRLDEEPK